MQTTVYHTLEPVYNAESRVLLLGTIPSPKSRETGFYYGHPQNRFWKTLAAVFDAPCPRSNAEKAAFLLARRLALWDVLAACEIDGAADASIRHPVANPIRTLVERTRIHTIFTTGKTADRLYQKYCAADTGIPAICLPSTSPANCACSLEKLTEAYGAVRQAAERG